MFCEHRTSLYQSEYHTQVASYSDEERIAHETLAFKYRDTKITRNFLEHLPSISIQEPGEVH